MQLPADAPGTPTAADPFSCRFGSRILFAPSLAFVDLETTGTVAAEDRVTEIGIVRVESGRVIDEWSTLVNPGRPIPPAIQALTGISDAMVAAAPVFARIAAEVRDRLQGAVFVAHNARFDYSFLKHEFLRTGAPFSARVLCTAKLSRRLQPEERRHHLDALVARHQLPAAMRHRALGDARLLWHLVTALHAKFAPERIRTEVQRILKVPSLPSQLPGDALESIPAAPGVYTFYGLNALPIYIGKSVNLRERVAEHFSSDYRSANDLRISSEIQRIECQETAGELGALLLEARLIRQQMPLHNRLYRRKLDLCALWVSDEARRPTVVPSSAVDDDGAPTLYGPFANRRSARATLRRLAAEHRLCWKLLGLERRSGPCFAYQVRKCGGACVGDESPVAHHQRLRAALAPHRFAPWPFRGAALVRENAPERGRAELQVFNRWRWLGSASDDAGVACLAAIDPLPPFDLDAYRILTGFLRRRPSAELMAIPDR